MAGKYVGYDKVIETKTKGVPRGQILVKLRRGTEEPRWEQMSRSEYERRSVLRKKSD